MNEPIDTIEIHANVIMTTASLQAIVHHAKTMAGPGRQGRHSLDTADLVSAMVSRFLLENDFESYVEDPANYPERNPSKPSQP